VALGCDGIHDQKSLPAEKLPTTKVLTALAEVHHRGYASNAAELVRLVSRTPAARQATQLS